VSERCGKCQGDGWTLESDHAPKCDGYTCAPDCPIPVQILCERCNGMGRVPAEAPDAE
jgi:hypothetical protein